MGISCSYSDITIHKLDLKPVVGDYFGYCFFCLISPQLDTFFSA